PRLAADQDLPEAFPLIAAPDVDSVDVLISQALAMRPELRLLDFARRQVEVDVRQACNQLLPAIDAAVGAAQDVGEPTSSKRDKSELELEAGLLLDVPLQRRAAQGKLRASQGKLAQLAAKRRLIEQKVGVEVRNAMTALAADYRQLEQARKSVELALRMEEAERIKFSQGGSTILLINLREQATADAELMVVEASADYFRSQAELHAAIAGELAAAQP
ncbi:MAG: TolC family protein, partial [Planctomycetales bacterium]|nr:TolC family protein [Planctomycetales bacterium]